MSHKKVHYVEVEFLNYIPGIKIKPWKEPLTTEKKMKFEIYNGQKTNKSRKWAMRMEIDAEGDLAFDAVDPETGDLIDNLFYIDGDYGTLEICSNVSSNLGLALAPDGHIVVNP